MIPRLCSSFAMSRPSLVQGTMQVLRLSSRSRLMEPKKRQDALKMFGYWRIAAAFAGSSAQG
jgi:hypothetical protein